jgi:hypothetical protein
VLHVQETYYVCPLSQGPGQKISKGKLPDKLRNKRKAMKSLGILDASSSQQQQQHDDGLVGGNYD